MKAGVLNEFGTPFSQDEFKEFDIKILPEMFQLAAENKLSIETHVETLENIETAWNQNIDPGKRLVISIQ